MQSKISFFNFTVFKKTCLRFFPIWCTYLFIWMMILPITYLNYWNVKFVPFNIADTIPQGSTVMTFIFGCASAMAVLSYTYNLRSSVMFHSLPISRETLFTTNYLAGLSFMIVPNLIVYGMTALVLLTKNGDMVKVMMALNTWLGATCGMSIFFYSFAILLGMLTGSWFMLPLLYTILNFTVIVVESIVRAALEVLLYGYSVGDPVLSYMSPPVHLMSTLRFTDYDKNEVILSTSSDAYVYLAGITIVGLVLAAAALILYRKRNVEMAGEIMSINSLRPVFKYCFATGCGLVIGSILYGILGYGNSPFAMYICLLIGVVLGYLIAEMAMKKSFKLNVKALKGLIVFTVVISLAFAILAFDLFGIESYVPDMDIINDATIYVSGDKISVSEGDISLDGILTLHSKIIEQKDESLTILDDRTFSGYVTWVTVDYRTDWGHARRYYNMPVDNSIINTQGSAQQMLESILNSEAYLKKKHAWAYGDILPYMVDIDYYGEYQKVKPEDIEIDENAISSALIETVNTEEFIVIVEPDERIGSLIESLKKDITAGVYSLFGENDAYNKFVGQIRFYYIEDAINGGYIKYMKGYEESQIVRRMYAVDVFEGSELEKLIKGYMEAEYINYMKHKLTQ